MPTASLLHRTKPLRALPQMDLRDMLLAGGAGQFMADLSICFMNFLPGTCDPYAQGVIQIVSGLQRLLNKHGARLEVDGGMGMRTLAALKVFAGPRWYEKSWAQLYADVLEGGPWQGFHRFDRAIVDEMTWLDPWGHQRAWRRGPCDPGGDALGAVGSDIRAAAVPWWCSPANPQGNCTPTPGVAKPMNAGTLELFKTIQRIANALLAKRGSRTLVPVDGRIGAMTLTALRTLSSTPAAITDVDVVARASIALSQEMESQRAAAGAPFVPDPAGSSPSVANPDGTVTHPAEAPRLSTTTMLLAAVGIGAVVALGGKKGRRK